MNNSTDKLLESLTDITYQSKQVLQEGSSSTFDRLLQLQQRLTGQIGGTTIKISSYDKALIEKVKRIKMDYSYRISTYPNIHNNKKYDIHAGCNVDFVLEYILDHIDNPKKDFNPKHINELAIAKTFHKLTGKKYEHETMSTDEFRYEYRSVAFGGFRKVLMIPKPLTLTRLYERSPYIVTYIDTRLIYSHIHNLNKYYKDIEDKFNKMTKNKPELTVSLNGYLSCLESSIKNTLIMYNAIRSTFLELNSEYKNIFNEIVSIERELNSISLDENIVNFYNSIFDEVNTLSETIDTINSSLNESISNNNEIELSKEIIKSKSFKSLIDKFTEEANINTVSREMALNNIKNYYGIISRISNQDLFNHDNLYRIYSNITNTIDMNNFMSAIKTKIDFCKTQFSELSQDDNKLQSITKTDILRELLKDISLCNDIPEEDNDNIIGKIISGIPTKIFGKPTITKINNLDAICDNIVNIPDYCKTINNHLKDMNKLIIELMDINIKSNQTNKSKLVNEKIINAYIGYNLIITCIFYNLLKFENKSLELVQALIDDLN